MTRLRPRGVLACGAPLPGGAVALQYAAVQSGSVSLMIAKKVPRPPKKETGADLAPASAVRSGQ
jgi:hypothetical protein